ncbi:MAG: PEGA domain-containing protein [Deinococcota bacterium]|jgi:hypothetical protein|nr:PEGA domain-containing protein [Deinococcota bacterium]
MNVAYTTAQRANLAVLWLSLILLTSGCALVAKGTAQDIAFTSAPEGAEVIIDGEFYGTTPLTIGLDVAKSHDVILRYRGQERLIHIANTVDPTWIALDVVPGLAVGTLIFLTAPPCTTGGWFSGCLGRDLAQSIALGVALGTTLPPLILDGATGAWYDLSPGEVFTDFGEEGD